jgi:hypothetical protein
MSPQAIPWLLCGALCLLPLVVGSGSFILLRFITNQHPTLERSSHVDEDGIKHTIIELTSLTREELKVHKHEEEKE